MDLTLVTNLPPQHTFHFHSISVERVLLRTFKKQNSIILKKDKAVLFRIGISLPFLQANEASGLNGRNLIGANPSYLRLCDIIGLPAGQAIPPAHPDAGRTPKQPDEISPKQRTKQGRKTASAGRKPKPQNSRTRSAQNSAPNKAGKLPQPDESRNPKTAGRDQPKTAHQTRPENCLSRTKAETPKQPDEVNKVIIMHIHI